MIPPRRGWPRKTTVVARRLDHLESELADMARLCTLFVEDMIALRDAVPRGAERLILLAGVIGALLAIADTDPALVGGWLLALTDDDLEAATTASEQIMDQVLLRHGDAAGEA